MVRDARGRDDLHHCQHRRPCSVGRRRSLLRPRVGVRRRARPRPDGRPRRARPPRDADGDAGIARAVLEPRRCPSRPTGTPTPQRVRDRSQLSGPCRRGGDGDTRQPARLHQVPLVSRRPHRGGRDAQRPGRLRRRARRGDRTRRQGHRSDRGVGPRRRVDRRPGHLRPGSAVRGPSAPLRSRQVVRHVRPHRPGDGVARLGRPRPAADRHRGQRRRRDRTAPPTR